MAEAGSCPWSGDERDAYVRDAADRSFVLDGVPNLGVIPGLFVEPCPRSVWIAPDDVEPTARAELHAIGVYQGPRDTAEGGERVARPVRVRVRRTAHPVLLVLMSYDSVQWELEVDGDASLGGVMLSSHAPSTVRCPVAIPGIIPLQNGPHEYTLEPEDPGEEGAATLIATLERICKLPLASFQGDYYGERYEVPCCKDASVVREVLARHRELRRQHTGAPPGPFLLVDRGHLWRHGTRDEPVAVPEQTLAVAFCEADGRYYAITHHALYAVDASGNAELIDAPPAEHVSWLGGIAYDTQRRRLVIATCWHTGFHHLYDPIAAHWTAVPVGESVASIAALAYEPTRDVVFALAVGVFGHTSLLALSPDLRAPHPQLGKPLSCGKIGVGNTAVAQMAAFPDALVICMTRDPDLAVMEPARPHDPRNRGLIVQLDGGRIQRFEPDAIPRPPTTPGDETGPGVASEPPRYEGWVYTADLARDPAGVVTQVATSGTPLLVIHRGRSAVMLARYDVYHGQLATLDETTFPDWQARLERARRELADQDFVPDDQVPGPYPFRRPHWPDPPVVRWTRQAMEDYERLEPKDCDLLSFLGIGEPLSVPMDASYAGLRAQPSLPDHRVILEVLRGEVRVAYIRTDARHTWGRVIDDPAPGAR